MNYHSPQLDWPACQLRICLQHYNICNQYNCEVWHSRASFATLPRTSVCAISHVIGLPTDTTFVFAFKRLTIVFENFVTFVNSVKYLSQLVLWLYVLLIEGVHLTQLVSTFIGVSSK